MRPLIILIFINAIILTTVNVRATYTFLNNRPVVDLSMPPVRTYQKSPNERRSALFPRKYLKFVVDSDISLNTSPYPPEEITQNPFQNNHLKKVTENFKPIAPNFVPKNAANRYSVMRNNDLTKTVTERQIIHRVVENDLRNYNNDEIINNEGNLLFERDKTNEENSFDTSTNSEDLKMILNGPEYQNTSTKKNDSVDEVVTEKDDRELQLPILSFTPIEEFQEEGLEIIIEKEESVEVLGAEEKGEEEEDIEVFGEEKRAKEEDDIEVFAREKKVEEEENIEELAEEKKAEEKEEGLEVLAGEKKAEEEEGIEVLTGDKKAAEEGKEAKYEVEEGIGDEYHEGSAMKRQIRSDNVIEEENQATTMTGYKFTDQEPRMMIHQTFRNINW